MASSYEGFFIRRIQLGLSYSSDAVTPEEESILNTLTLPAPLTEMLGGFVMRSPPRSWCSRGLNKRLQCTTTGAST